MFERMFNKKKSRKSALVNLPTNLIFIDPSKDNQRINKSSFKLMCESIKSHGVLQPVIVRNMPNNFFEILYGKELLKAVRALGIKEIPSIITDLEDKDIYNLTRAELEVRRNGKMTIVKRNKIKATQNTQEFTKNKIDIINKTRGVKDIRILMNTVNQAIEIMKRAGAKIYMIQKDSDSEIEIKIKVEKT